MKISGISILKWLTILLLSFACLYLGKAFLVPFAISGVVATLFLPLCRKIERFGVHKGIAAFFCVIILIVFITGLGYVLGWQIQALSNDATLIKERLTNMIDAVQSFILEHFGITVNKQMELVSKQQSAIGSTLSNVAGSIASILTSFLLMLVYIFLLLLYRSHIKKFILMLVKDNETTETDRLIESVAYVSQQYLVGLSKMIGCLWIMYGIAFSLLGVKNALFFAFICGILEIIPFIGNITGTSLTLLVSAAQGSSPSILIGIVGTYGAIQFIQGWLLEPIIVGPQVRINPLFTIIALIVGELLWGVPGIFLAIPLTAMLKIVFDNVSPLQPYGFLIGEEPRNKEPK